MFGAETVGESRGEPRDGLPGATLGAEPKDESGSHVRSRWRRGLDVTVEVRRAD